MHQIYMYLCFNACFSEKPSPAVELTNMTDDAVENTSEDVSTSTHNTDADTTTDNADDGTEESTETQHDEHTSYILKDVIIAGMSTQVDILIVEQKITAIGANLSAPEAFEIALQGHWVAPAFIDSHVHFAYLSKEQEMLAKGVCAAVDLAAPTEFLAQDLSPMQMRQSGPMITAMNGYPTQSWGANGYGIQCPDVACVEESVDSLHQLGAKVVKLPISSNNSLAEEQLRAAVTRAQQHNLITVSHAMSNPQVIQAATVGVDILAHTPNGVLSVEALQAWSGRAVISTLAAFGGSNTAVENLRSLYEVGATVLYGTDFGNSQEIGISASEISLLREVGLSDAQILSSGTKTPAEVWGFTELGEIAVGKTASLLVLEEDPHQNIMVLTQPKQVWINGKRRDD